MNKIAIISIIAFLFSSILSASLPEIDSLKNDDFIVKRLLSGHTDSILFVTQLKNGLLATAGRDSIIVIQNIETGEVVRTLTGHTGIIYEVRQLSDGTLVSASNDKTVRFWDAETGENIRTIVNDNPRASGFYSLAELPGNRLAVGSGFGTIVIYDSVTLEKLYQDRVGAKLNNIRRIKLLKDGTLTAAEGGWITLHEIVGNSLKNTNIYIGHNGAGVFDIEELDNGLIASGASDKTIDTWELERVIRKRWYSTGSYVNQIKKLPNNHIASAQEDGTIKIWNLNEIKPVYELIGHTRRVSSLELLDDGNLASASSDLQIIIWDIKKILNL